MTSVAVRPSTPLGDVRVLIKIGALVPESILNQGNNVSIMPKMRLVIMKLFPH
jgi:hypothetical protein